MSHDFKTSIGNLETMLKCPGCGFYGLVYYKTQPPRYCSDACKQRAYRKRKIRNSPNVTYLFRQWEEEGLGLVRGRLERILERWGPDAAKEAAALALDVARQVREVTRRY